MRSNPERGFRHELHPDTSGTLSPLQLSQLSAFNLTVAQTYWYLRSRLPLYSASRHCRV